MVPSFYSVVCVTDKQMHKQRDPTAQHQHSTINLQRTSRPAHKYDVELIITRGLFLCGGGWVILVNLCSVLSMPVVMCALVLNNAAFVQRSRQTMHPRQNENLVPIFRFPPYKSEFRML